VREISLPEVAYGATAVRSQWSDLPLTLRSAIGAQLGGEVGRVRPAGGGFTRAFAAVVTTVGGERAFVKAAPVTDPTADWYAREAAVTAALPVGVPAARPLWVRREAGWFVLGLEALDARVPGLPWVPGELAAALRAWRVSAAALAEPPEALRAVGLPGLPEIVRGEMSWWSEFSFRGRTLPPAPAWVPSRLGELVELEQALPALVGGGGVLHGDLRVDNVLLDAGGAAWLCDWTWPCLGAPWFDAVTLLVSAFASGLDADALVTQWDAPADGVDGALAALGGYWLERAAGGPSSASPHSRQHQRFSGTQALAWLAARRGWS
jgi:hypothetical protein